MASGSKKSPMRNLPTNSEHVKLLEQFKRDHGFINDEKGNIKYVGKHATQNNLKVPATQNNFKVPATLNNLNVQGKENKKIFDDISCFNRVPSSFMETPHKNNLANSFNISDFLATTASRSQQLNESFEPTGRSTMCGSKNDCSYAPPSESDDIISLDDILATSRVDEIRNMSIRASIAGGDFCQQSFQLSESMANEFASVSESKLMKDQIQWEAQNATIPTSMTSSMADDEVPIMPHKNKEGDGTLSMSNFFAKFNEDLEKMLPNSTSPIKTQRPAPLVSQERKQWQTESMSSMDSETSLDSTINYIQKVIKKFEIDKQTSEDLLKKIQSNDKRRDRQMEQRNISDEPERDIDLQKEFHISLGSENKENSIEYQELIVDPNEIQTPHSSLSTMHNVTSKTYNVNSTKKPESSTQTRNKEGAAEESGHHYNSRKRSRSALDVTNTDHENSKVEIDRRSKSPSTYNELRVTAGNNSTTTTHQTPYSSFLKPAYSSPHIRAVSKSPTTSNISKGSGATTNSHIRSPNELRNYSLPLLPSYRHEQQQLRQNCHSPQYDEFFVIASHRQSNDDYMPRSGFPVRAAKISISWGSVRLRKTQEKSVAIKNFASHRVTLKVEIVGPGFQLSNIDQVKTISLHQHECRTIKVAFCPTMIGEAVGSVNLIVVGENSLVRKIPLYGYGGHSSVQVENVQMGPNGQAGLKFLPLGDVRQLPSAIKSRFTLANRGTLAAFAIIEIHQNHHEFVLGPLSINISPSKLTIPPNSSKQIEITFTPAKKEIKNLLKLDMDVIQVASVRIVCGDEPTRIRIKSIIKKAKDHERGRVLNRLNAICTEFTNDYEFGDRHELVDRWDTVNDLTSTFQQHRIELTLNRNCEDTLIDFGNDSDEDQTICFRSLICHEDDDSLAKALPLNSTRIQPNSLSASSSAGPISIDSNFDNDAKHVVHSSGGTWTVSPSIIVINNTERSGKLVKAINIKSNLPEKEVFDVRASCKGFCTFTPTGGEIYPNSVVQVRVEIDFDFIKRHMYYTDQISVQVFLENERFKVPIIY